MSAQEALDLLEKRIRSALDKQHAPIMGPCLEAIRSGDPELLRDKLFEQLERAMHRGGDDAAGRLGNVLLKWPAVSVIMLTQAVSNGYSDDNEYAVHSIIEALLGLQRRTSMRERERLWKGFREACRRLGLEVNSRESGGGYIVEEYLHQAGLPLSFVPNVTESMLRTADEIGLPTDDDPFAITCWQEYLQTKTRYLPKTAKNALERDVTGFYVRTFLSAVSTAVAQEPNSVAGLMSTEIHRRELGSGRRGEWKSKLTIARLVLRDDAVSIELPPGEGQEWSITVDGNRVIHLGEAAPSVLPLLADLPGSIEVRSSNHFQQFSLWPNQADNHLLVFGSDGRFFQSATLGQSPVRLPPGEYTLLLRFEPSGDIVTQCVSTDPALYLMPLTLLPGSTHSICRGPVSVQLTADSRPWLRFEGKSIATLSREEVWCLSGLEIAVHVGAADNADESVTYDLRVASGSADLGCIPLESGSLSLEKVCQKLKAGVHRVVVELCPRGTRRAVARSACLLWKDLIERDSGGRLICNVWPENILPKQCLNTTLDERFKRIGPSDSTRSSFQLEFQGPPTPQGISGRTLTLEWAVPGVFMKLQDFFAQPVFQSDLKPGVTLAASLFSRELLQIRSTDNGRLLLEGREIRTIGADTTISIHISSLAEKLETGGGTLALVTASGSRELLRLTIPHGIVIRSTNRTPHELEITFEVLTDCKAARLQAYNFLSGAQCEVEVSCDDPSQWSESARLRLESISAQFESRSYRLTVPAKNWSSGAWLYDLEIQLGTRWGAPTNQRRDVVAFGLLVGEDGRTASNIEDVIRSDSGTLIDGILGQAFNRVHQALQRCYMEECWSTLVWLKPLWKRWLSSLSQGTNEQLRLLIRLTQSTPPHNSSATWLPLVRVEAQKPELFTLPADLYHKVDQNDGLLSASLILMSQLERPLHIFPSELFGELASGFGLLDMIQGNRPRDFNFRNYYEALFTIVPSPGLTETWRPGPGFWLGMDHYQVAWDQLKTRYRKTLSGNEVRRKDCDRLCRHMRRQCPADALLLYPNKTGSSESFEDSLQGDVIFDFLRPMEVFISSFAKICREDVRNPGKLTNHCFQLGSFLGPGACSLDMVLSYILQLGSDLFGFYLLLWEVILSTRTVGEIPGNG